MAARHHDIFEAIRDHVVDHLTGGQAGADPGTEGRTVPRGAAGGGPAQAPQRAQLAGVVAKLQRFVESGDLGRFREFLRRWAAMRLGEGGSPESILHAVTAIGDTVVRFAHERAEGRPDLDAFARDVARAGFWATRMTVEVLSDELDRREREHRELVEGGLG